MLAAGVWVAIGPSALGDRTTLDATRTQFALPLDAPPVNDGLSAGGMTLIHLATQAAGSEWRRWCSSAPRSFFPESAREIMRGTAVDQLTPEDYERGRRIHKHGDEQIRALRRQFRAFKDSYDDRTSRGPASPPSRRARLSCARSIPRSESRLQPA
jgi:hypothetical protein